MNMGTSPQTPGIFRFRARTTGGGGVPPRRSGTASGARVPFLESPILRRGIVSIALPPGSSANSMPISSCRRSFRYGINLVSLAVRKWPVLK